MADLAQGVLVVLVLSNLALLGARRLATSVRLLSLQGIALGAVVLLFPGELRPEVVLLAVGVAALKGALYPWVLERVRSRVKAHAEEEPLVGYTALFLSGVLALAVSFVVAPSLVPAGREVPALAMPVAFATVIAGLTLTMARRTALAQVIGYVVLENGVFLFALTLVGDLPLLLEMGALLEVFFAVFVMGIAVDRISREFATIDVDVLDQLRG